MSTYVPPPPPPQAYGRPNNNSCFKWGALGCGGCFILVLLAGIGMYMALKPFGGAFKDSMQVAMDMALLRKQIMRYKEDTGKYPDKLEDLVPKYVQSAAALRLSTHPEGPEYTYHKPGPNAEPDEVLLEYTITVKSPDGEKVEVPVRMQINGRTRQGGTMVTPPPGRSRRSSSGQPAPSGAD